MAQVSRQTHLSMLPDSHGLLINFILDFQTGHSIFGSSTSSFVQVRDFKRVPIQVEVPATCR